MICTRCGARNTDTARFCKKCGNRLEPQRPAQGRKKGIIIGFIAAMILIACGGVYIYAGKACSPEASLDRMLDRLAKRDVMGAFGECVFTPEEQASIDRALYSGDIVTMTFVESSDKFLGIFPKWKMKGSSLDDFLY